MTAQLNQNTVASTVAHPIRIKLPVAAMARIANRMIERRQQRVLREMPDHLRRSIVSEVPAERSF